MNEPDDRILLFGEFAFQLTPLRLSRNGVPVEARTQVLRLLALLVQRPGELLTHHEIHAALWNGRIVDFSRGEHVCIRQLRSALGDLADRPRFIETVHRSGYRFVAPVRADRAAPRDRFAPAPSRRRQLRRLAAGVAAAVVGAILPWVAHQGPAAVPTESPVARQAYLRGRYLLDAGTPEQVARSLPYLRVALTADPNYAAAHVGLADGYRRLGQRDHSRAHAARAVAIAPDSAAAHLQVAIALMQDDWNWTRAGLHLERALALEPDSARAHQLSATRYALVGDLRRAVAQMDHALDLDPASTLLRSDHGWLLYLAGNNRGAIARCREALELDPRHIAALLCIERAAEAESDYAIAATAAQEAMRLWGAPDAEREAIASLAAEDAIRAFRRWRLRFYTTYPDRASTSADDMADVHAAVGDFKTALMHLERAAELKSPTLPFLLADPLLAPLRDQARFADLRVRLNLPVPAEGFEPPT